ncbi:MAG: AlpA family phage regulatory protein [Acidobacteria bacterium]|nr:AlpA family phage regulatory protein [Acidobacteriota bacterium]
MTTQTRLLRRTEVERFCQIGRSTIYRLMREGLFPVPIRVGPRAVRWPEHELTAWLARRPRATGESGRSADVARGSQPVPDRTRD